MLRITTHVNMDMNDSFICLDVLILMDIYVKLGYGFVIISLVMSQMV